MFIFYSELWTLHGILSKVRIKQKISMKMLPLIEKFESQLEYFLFLLSHVNLIPTTREFNAINTVKVFIKIWSPMRRETVINWYESRSYVIDYIRYSKNLTSYFLFSFRMKLKKNYIDTSCYPFWVKNLSDYYNYWYCQIKLVIERR